TAARMGRVARIVFCTEGGTTVKTGMLAILGVAVLALLATGALAAEPGKAADPHAGHWQACAKTCAECMTQCESCCLHCAQLVADGKKEHANSMRLCADCADVCCCCAKLCSRQGPASPQVLEACIKSCDQCAESCEKAPGDDHM